MITDLQVQLTQVIKRKRHFAFESWLIPLLVGAAGVGIALNRSYITIRHPELYAEDGVVWFSNAYQLGPLTPLIQPHTGYLQTFPRLIADVGLLIPLRWLPAFFVMIALGVQILPGVFIVTQRFARLIPSIWMRLGIAILYFLIPNSFEVNSNLTNAQWHLALLAFMIVVADEGNLSWKICDIIIITFSGLTGPFIIVLAPLTIFLYLVRRNRWSWILGMSTIVLAALQSIVLLTSARGKFAGLGASGTRFVELVGGQVVGGTFAGPPATLLGGSLSQNASLDTLLFSGSALLVCFVLWKGPLELKLFNLYTSAILLAGLLAPVASLTEPQWQALVGDVGIRYWFFPTISLLIDCVWMMTCFRMWKGLSAVIGAICLGVCCAFGIPNSFHIPTIEPRPNWELEVAHFDALPNGRSYTFYEVPSGWSFTLVRH